MPTRRHLIALAGASVVAPGLMRLGRASPWPDRTVHIVVPLAAGGPTDFNARVVAEQLAKMQFGNALSYFDSFSYVFKYRWSYRLRSAALNLRSFSVASSRGDRSCGTKVRAIR
jgi:hypothetical protein